MPQGWYYCKRTAKVRVKYFVLHTIVHYFERIYFVQVGIIFLGYHSTFVSSC